MVTIIVIVLLGLFVAGLFYKELKRREEAGKQKEEAEKLAIELGNYKKFVQEEHEDFLKNLKDKYGDISNQFEFRGLHGAVRQAYVFEDSELIVIAKGNYIRDIIPFASIVDFNVEKADYQITSSGKTTITTTDTGSMLARGIIGGLFLGKLGALLGAASADRISETYAHTPSVFSDYTINITLNSLSSPTYVMEFKGNSYLCTDVANILLIILKRNETGKNDLQSSEQLSLTDMRIYRSEEEDDPLLEEAARGALDSGYTLASYLERRLDIPEFRAKRIIQQLINIGILGEEKDFTNPLIVNELQLEQILRNRKQIGLKN